MITSPNDWLAFNARLMIEKPTDYKNDADIKHCMLLGKRAGEAIKFVQSVGWLPEVDPNDFRQQYHLAVAFNVIPEIAGCKYYFEVGAGIGAMAKVVLSRNPTAVYDIYDLPGLKQIQRHNLWDYRDNVCWQAYPDEPTFRLEKPSAFIANYSLSEMEFSDRDKLVRVHPFDYYLITYQATWGKLDNFAWFDNLQKRVSDVEWKKVDATHLIGKRK